MEATPERVGRAPGVDTQTPVTRLAVPSPAAGPSASAASAAEAALRGRLRSFLPGFYFLSFAALGSFVPYLALELEARGASGWLLAGTLGMLPLGRLLAGPTWSVLADRTNAPGLMIRAGAVLALLGAVALVVGPLGSLVLASLLFAVGRAPLGPLVDGLALRALEGDRDAYGHIRLFGSLGFLVSTFAAGAARDHLGLDPLLLGLAASGALALLVQALPPVDAPRRVAIGPALGELLRDPVILGLFGAASLHFSVHVATTSFLAVHLEALGHATTWTGGALAFGVAVEVGVMATARWWLGRFGPRRLFLLALALALPRWGAMALVSDPVAIVAVQGLHGLTFGLFWLTGVALFAGRARPEVAHSAQAVFAAAVGGVGALLGMVGGSLLVDAEGTWAIFHAGVLLAGLALALATWALSPARPLARREP